MRSLPQCLLFFNTRVNNIYNDVVFSQKCNNIARDLPLYQYLIFSCVSVKKVIKPTFRNQITCRNKLYSSGSDAAGRVF